MKLSNSERKKKSQNERWSSIKALPNPGFADCLDNDIRCHFILSPNLCFKKIHSM